MNSSTRFIDDEAIVDNDSDQEDQTSGESNNSACDVYTLLCACFHLSTLGFLDDDDEGGSSDSDPAPESASPGWSNLTDEQLRQIASDICNRHRTSNISREDEHNEEGDRGSEDELAALPTVEHKGIWRVRVMVSQL